MRIALLQHACPLDASHESIVAQTMAMIRQAAGDGAQFAVTQELFHCPYFPQWEQSGYFDWAQPIPGPMTHRLGELAKELQITIAASIFEKRAAGLHHNSTVVLNSAGQIQSLYRKMHIPHDPRFYEKYYFSPGEHGFLPADEANQTHGDTCRDGAAWPVVEVAGMNVATLICWDQWFPEAARLGTLAGADALLYPTAIGTVPEEPAEEHQRQFDAWMTIQRSHAIANGVFVAAVNRIGVEQDITFWGSSFVCDPGGHILAQASRDQAEVLVVDCDRAMIEDVRRAWPFLRDRRIDAYQGLLRRFGSRAQPDLPKP